MQQKMMFYSIMYIVVQVS